jgi:hypothetical protein
MRRFVLAAIVVLAAAAYPVATFAGPGGSDNGTMCALSTQLRSENEVPASTSEAFGHTLVTIHNDLTLEWKTHIVNDGGTYIASHIHRAPVGVAGPVVVPFGAPSSGDQITHSGEVPIAEALAADICANPQNFYVNYHTTAFPTGNIRGQLG